MSYNTKNYTEQGGEKTVIGGTLSFEDGAKVENFPGGGGSDIEALQQEVNQLKETVEALQEKIDSLVDANNESF